MSKAKKQIMDTSNGPESSTAVSDEPSVTADKDSKDSESIVTPSAQQADPRLYVGKSFSSFAEFQHDLDELKKGGSHPFRVFNSQTGKNYNMKRVGRKYSTDPVDITKFEYTYYSVRCVHYGDVRSRGKGLRPNQRHFPMGCQAKITASYDKLQNKIIVREFDIEHNHRTGDEIMQHYPSARRLSKTEQKDVEEIIGLKPNNKHVQNLISKKYGKHVTLKDIQNLKTKARERTRGGLKDAQLALDGLTEALEADSNACGGVVVDEDNTLLILYYQSCKMRKTFKKFPEILFVDGTYNVNKLGMPLYCLMVEDGFGHGRNVFYAATAQEDATHLQKIVQLFKETNEPWKSIGVIIIDKDFTEYKVLKEEFPNAVILYCQWHVIKALFKCLSDYDVNKGDRDDCRQIIRSLVFSSSQSEYERWRQELVDSTNEEFRKAFWSNWDSCKSMWVTFERDQAVHFANTTNNRLESHNQKLKDVTSRSSSLSEMFQNVLLYVRTTESENLHVSFTEEFTSRSTMDSNIPGVSEIQSACTQYAADIIVNQLKVAKSVEYEVKVSNESNKATISYQDRSHLVSLDIGTCSCTFQRTMLMPCRHVFKYRLHCGLEVFNRSLVADRWLKQFQIHVCDDDFQNDDGQSSNEAQISSVSATSYLGSTLARNQKYRKILSLTDKLAVMASQCGMPEFRQKYATIESLVHMWEENVPFMVVPITDSSSSTEDKLIKVSTCSLMCRISPKIGPYFPL